MSRIKLKYGFVNKGKRSRIKSVTESYASCHEAYGLCHYYILGVKSDVTDMYIIFCCSFITKRT